MKSFALLEEGLEEGNPVRFRFRLRCGTAVIPMANFADRTEERQHPPSWPNPSTDKWKNLTPLQKPLGSR